MDGRILKEIACPVFNSKDILGKCVMITNEDDVDPIYGATGLGGRSEAFRVLNTSR